LSVDARGVIGLGWMLDKEKEPDLYAKAYGKLYPSDEEYAKDSFICDYTVDKDTGEEFLSTDYIQPVSEYIEDPDLFVGVRLGLSGLTFADGKQRIDKARDASFRFWHALTGETNIEPKFHSYTYWS